MNLHQSPCKICANAAGNGVHSAREMMHGLRDTFQYAECTSCGCIALLNPPEEWSRYYSNSYYSYSKVSWVKRHVKALRNRYQWSHSGFLGAIALKAFGASPLVSWIQRSGTGAGAKILDVGCGSGSMLRELEGLGFAALVGVDPHMPVQPRAASNNGSGKVFLKKIAPTELTESFDLIMMHHSFEHVEDPERDLRHLAGCLSNNGRLIIRIPVAGCLAWKQYGVNWVQLDPPRHTFLFSEESLALLAGRCGLEIYDREFDSTSMQFWGSELYQKDIPLLDKKSPWVSPQNHCFTHAQMMDWDDQSIALNKSGEGDQAVFYLRKTGMK